jgi:hypothetical protein
MKSSSSPQSQFSTLHFHHFSFLKNALKGCHFADDSELKHSVSYKDGKSVLIMRETLCKSSLKFVRHVPMTYVNLIVIVSVISEKKIGNIAFVLLLLLQVAVRS